MPYKIDYNLLFSPLHFTIEEYLHLWNRLPNTFIINTTLPGLSYAEIEHTLQHTPFCKIFDKHYGSDIYIQVAYAGISWFNDIFCFIISGSLDTSNASWHLRFEFRFSSLTALYTLREGIDYWVKRINPLISIINNESSSFNNTSKQLTGISNLMFSTEDLNNYLNTIRRKTS